MRHLILGIVLLGSMNTFASEYKFSCIATPKDDIEETYGSNGYHRVTWGEEYVAHNNKKRLAKRVAKYYCENEEQRKCKVIICDNNQTGLRSFRY